MPLIAAMPCLLLYLAHEPHNTSLLGISILDDQNASIPTKLDSQDQFAKRWNSALDVASMAPSDFYQKHRRLKNFLSRQDEDLERFFQDILIDIPRKLGVPTIFKQTSFWQRFSCCSRSYKNYKCIRSMVYHISSIYSIIPHIKYIQYNYIYSIYYIP